VGRHRVGGTFNGGEGKETGETFDGLAEIFGEGLKRLGGSRKNFLKLGGEKKQGAALKTTILSAKFNRAIP